MTQPMQNMKHQTLTALQNTPVSGTGVLPNDWYAKAQYAHAHTRPNIDANPTMKVSKCRG